METVLIDVIDLMMMMIILKFKMSIWVYSELKNRQTQKMELVSKVESSMELSTSLHE